jgi:hypothetical protein
MSPGVTVGGKAKPFRRSRSESKSEKGAQSPAVDPKRDDLPMARVKVG